MKSELKTKRTSLSKWFRLCPGRHFLFLWGLVLTLGYHILKDNKRLMAAVCRDFTRPYHRLAGRISGILPVSAAELIYAALAVILLVHLVVEVCRIARRPEKMQRLYRLIMSFLSVGLFLYGGFCLLWGVFYAGSDFQADMGLWAEPVSTEELYDVTAYFASLANTYASETSRDENGCFWAEREELFNASTCIYEPTAEQFPCLDGPPLRAKEMLFSRFMSWINFTGFFFPFTGEANLNVDAPLCLLPSTIAHELAHQRGVAPEDEANFAAVLACLNSDYADYRYSGALLALIHLGNALYDADPALWEELRGTYGEAVLADLRQNNAYWQQFETKAAAVSEGVYEGFLASYGDERGLKSYGACVDLLVAYYRDAAAS